MTKLIKIEQSRHGTVGGCILRFDDGTYLRAALTAVTDLGLFTGKDFDGDELDELKAELKSRSSKARAAAMIGARQLSEYELKKRLVEKGNTEKDAEKAAEWLKELGAVNDAEYASHIARRYASRGYGAAKIKDEFFRRGIPRELWDDALSQYCTDEGSIDRFLSSKIKDRADKKELKKVTDALYRRGYSWEEIKEALLRFENGISEE